MCIMHKKFNIFTKYEEMGHCFGVVRQGFGTIEFEKGVWIRGLVKGLK